MKAISKLVLLLFSLIVLISCEAQKEINVFVLNEETGSPISGALVKVMAGKGGDFTKSGDEGHTNRNGNYETNIMIGCAGGCYDIKINYSKEGFKTVERMNQIQDTVYLIPMESVE
jgi:hypothetical protein